MTKTKRDGDRHKERGVIVRLPDDVRTALAARAEAEGRTITAVARRAVVAYLAVPYQDASTTPPWRPGDNG
jgi:hypothetical protein